MVIGGTLPRLRVVAQVRGVVVMCTRLLHSLYPSPSPFSLPLSLPPLQPRLSLSLPLPFSLSLSLSLSSTERARLAGALSFARGHYHSLLGAHGLGAHGFSTERARLAGALRFTRGFQKMA